MTVLLEDFRRAAAAASCGVRSEADEAAAARWCLDVARGATVVVAPSVAHQAPALFEALLATCHVTVSDSPDAASVVADAAVGVAVGQLAVAETGSVLVLEHDVPDRVVTMLVRHLIVIVTVGDLVASLDAVGEWLADRAGQASFVSLMTGPSRSADIERSLSIGVQGPEEVTVVVLG